MIHENSYCQILGYLRHRSRWRHNWLDDVTLLIKTLCAIAQRHFVPKFGRVKIGDCPLGTREKWMKTRTSKHSSKSISCEFLSSKSFSCEPLSYENPPMAAFPMLTNSCEVFSCENYISIHVKSSHLAPSQLNPCEFFSCEIISSQLMWNLLMWNHLIPTHVKSSHVESSHVKSSHVESSHVKSSHVKSSHAKSFHLNSCEVFSCDTISTQPMRILLRWNHLIFSCNTFSCEIFSCEIISSQLMWNLLMWNLLMWNLLMWRRITLTHVNCLVSKPTHPNLHKNYKVWTGANTVTQCKDSDEFRPNISHRQSVGLHVKIPSETLRESIPWYDFCWDREQHNTIPSILKPARLYPVL